MEQLQCKFMMQNHCVIKFGNKTNRNCVAKYELFALRNSYGVMKCVFANKTEKNLFPLHPTSILTTMEHVK